MSTLTHRLCVAPMMDWTDRHCRYFLRLHLAARAPLHRDDHGAGARARRRRRTISTSIRPSIRSRCSSAAAIPAQLARAARARRALGLRRDQPQLRLPVRARADRELRRVPDGASPRSSPIASKAMRDAVRVPVTVKHRIGLDDGEDYGFVRDFVGTVARGRLRGVHRPRAQRRAEGAVAEGEPRGSAAALRRRASAEARFPGADDRAQRRASPTATRSSASSRTSTA